MAFDLTDGLEVDVTVVGRDAEGNATEIDASSPLQATSSDENIATVVPGPENNSVTVKSTPGAAALGEVTITITGDGDAGEGVVPISVDFVCTVVSGDTVSLSALAGDPRTRTDAAPTPEPEPIP